MLQRKKNEEKCGKTNKIKSQNVSLRNFYQHTARSVKMKIFVQSVSGKIKICFDTG